MFVHFFSLRFYAQENQEKLTNMTDIFSFTLSLDKSYT